MAKSKKKSAPTLKELQTAAREMNKVMDLDPKIKIVKDSSKLIADMKKNGLPFVCPQEQDEYTERTWAVLLELGCKPENNEDCDEAAEDDEVDTTGTDEEEVEDSDDEDSDDEDEDSDDEDEDSDDEDDEDEDSDDEDEDEEDLATLVSKTKKLDDLKDIIDHHDEFKKLRKKAKSAKGLDGQKALRAAMIKIVGKPEKAAKKKVNRGPSPYGTAVELMCADPDQSKESLLKGLTKAGIDTDAGKAGIQTAWGSVRKIVGLLRDNGLMKAPAKPKKSKKK